MAATSRYVASGPSVSAPALTCRHDGILERPVFSRTAGAGLLRLIQWPASVWAVDVVAPRRPMSILSKQFPRDIRAAFVESAPPRRLPVDKSGADGGPPTPAHRIRRTPRPYQEPGTLAKSLLQVPQLANPSCCACSATAWQLPPDGWLTCRRLRTSPSTRGHCRQRSWAHLMLASPRC